MTQRFDTETPELLLEVLAFGSYWENFTIFQTLSKNFSAKLKFSLGIIFVFFIVCLNKMATNSLVQLCYEFQGANTTHLNRDLPCGLEL